MSNEAYVIIKQNEYMRKFRNAGATDPLRAKSLADLGIKPDRIFHKMEEKAVFLPGRAPGTYYIDPSAADDFIEARRRRTFYLLLLVLAVAAVLFFLGRR
ncbi:MAG TPA: hypothetical protein VMY15_00835 [Candidatus Latescibacteria bacterium]|nr:hypothetical protein [Candidatus Latescibacterota bacterium]